MHFAIRQKKPSMWNWEFDCRLMCSLSDIQGKIFEWVDSKVVSEEVSAEDVEKFQRKLEMMDLIAT